MKTKTSSKEVMNENKNKINWIKCEECETWRKTQKGIVFYKLIC